MIDSLSIFLFSGDRAQKNRRLGRF
ncbi:hypothetical protein THICB1_120001 [Thiomonas arsenitoxydans]|uniref:Uncharacterized protein n=1 Tax=Thiomonas arsenitoxydans (strain DSM 22701 / CIP 110005 / 3As) TaxID=426114 RepID=A0ABM9T6L4_THIA3|nr:hypothetical protein THICB1_120001 [Thiomonas arsenitoxydans]CQR35345.1 hypothetical protein THICB6_210043 [Thiomonas arsenitoxydans]